MERQHSDGRRDAVPPITDPLLAWAVATEFLYFGEYPERIPLLVESPKTGPRAVAERFKPTESRAALIEVPAMFLSPPGGIDEFPYFCILLNADPGLRAEVFRALATLEAEGLRYEFGLPQRGTGRAAPRDARRPFGTALDHLGPAPRGGRNGVRKDATQIQSQLRSPTHSQMQSQTPAPQAPSSAPPASSAVVMGIVDDGIAFAHDRFRGAGAATTRIEHVWLQDMALAGMELDRSDIEAALAACTHCGLVDETEVYRVTGAEDYASATHKALGRGTVHGTHVLDLAAGADPGAPPANRPIIAVQLPDRVVRDTSGAYLTPYAVWGIYYILDRALGLNPADPAPPVVVNLSYDIFNGPHDGTSVFEKAVDWLVGVWYPACGGRAAVVLPAGNNLLWRSHVYVESLEGGKKQSFDWRLVPDDRTPGVVEFWLDRVEGSTQAIDVRVNVTAPDGVASGWIKLGDPPFVHPAPFTPGPPMWQVHYDPASLTKSRPRITLVTAATSRFAHAHPGERVAPAGVWKIEFHSMGGPASLHGWTRRDDTPFGWPVLGRQAYFEDRLYQRFDAHGREQEKDNASPIKRRYTVNGLATGVRTVVIAGCRSSDTPPAMATYSASGPVVSRLGTFGPLQRVGDEPDASAVSDQFPGRRGVLAAGSRSNSARAMSGTSVAAPQIARFIANQFETGQYSARTLVQDYAKYREGKHGGTIDHERTGQGRIDDQVPPGRVAR